MSTEPSPLHGDGETPEQLSPSPDEQPGRRRRRQLTAVAVAAGVLVVGGGAAYWASSAVHGQGNSASKPPNLELDNLAAQSGGHRADGAAGHGSRHGIAPGEPSGAGPFRAEGDLPDGPKHASVYRPGGSVSRGAVAELAKALKVPGEPAKHGGDWVVREGKDSGTLTVRADGSSSAGTWSYARKGAAGDVACSSVPPQRGKASGDSDAAAVQMACPGGPGGTPSAQKGEPLSEKKAEEAVRPVLKAAHLDGASLDPGMAMGGLRMVNASPRVAGMPTQGWETMFALDSGGHVAHAHGHLGTLDKGAAYPVVSAKQGLRQLNKQAAGGGSKDGGSKDGAGRGGKKKFTIQSSGATSPTKVSKAEFGLATQYSNGKPVLVPSWLYETRDGSGHAGRTAATAVQPTYLKPSGGSGSSHSESGSGSAPGAAESPGGGRSHDSGSGSAPAHAGKPGTSPAQAASGFSAHGRTLKVTFWGGVCGGYKATADESAKSVRITVRPKKPSDAKKVCVKMAKRQSVEVKLDKPLGDRKVVDGRDNDKLPATK